MMHTSDARNALLTRLFDNRVPRLWCPTLTHFRAPRLPDFHRIRAHLKHVSPYVGGLLVPGSTSEGWEMNDDDIHTLLREIVGICGPLKFKLLVGVLKTDLASMLACIDSLRDILLDPCVVGITVCPPKGSGLSQHEIARSLSEVLDIGLPTALYQLPQVTENEMSPETVRSLAEKYANFILFKDTSGNDIVAKSDIDMDGIFKVRGSEQAGYATWPKTAGGPYDGFLLSTANCFAKEYDTLLTRLEDGQMAQAKSISDRLEAVVSRAFAIISAFPYGNPFTNANKLLDHCFAFGSDANSTAPPMLYSGVRLPSEFVADGVKLLEEFDFMPTQGYLHDHAVSY
jgi:dihydrodipicolinate synthase/N-acetylneuraminate lyase